MMKPHKISLIHAIALVALGSFGAMSSESMTAWIPTVFGVLLLACNRGVKNENESKLDGRVRSPQNSHQPH